MQEVYIAPEVEISYFEAEDIVTASIEEASDDYDFWCISGL